MTDPRRSEAVSRLMARTRASRTRGLELLLAMQKVEGSNPFSRFIEIPLPSGISSF
jgi:hypothetical protein